MLMNGIGLVGKVHRLDAFLDHLKLLLKPNGQILLDSSDIIYMFEEDGDVPPRNDTYYGEVEFTLAYKGKKRQAFFLVIPGFQHFTRIRMGAEFGMRTCKPRETLRLFGKIKARGVLVGMFFCVIFMVGKLSML